MFEQTVLGEKDVRVIVGYIEVVKAKEPSNGIPTAPVIMGSYIGWGSPVDRIEALKASSNFKIPENVFNERDVVEDIKDPSTPIQPETYQFIMGYTSRVERIGSPLDDGGAVKEVIEVFTEEGYIDFLKNRRDILSKQANDEFHTECSILDEGVVNYLKDSHTSIGI